MKIHEGVCPTCGESFRKERWNTVEPPIYCSGGCYRNKRPAQLPAEIRNDLERFAWFVPHVLSRLSRGFLKVAVRRLGSLDDVRQFLWLELCQLLGRLTDYRGKIPPFAADQLISRLHTHMNLSMHAYQPLSESAMPDPVGGVPYLQLIPQPDAEQTYRDEIDHALDAVEQLPEREVAMVCAYYLEGKTYARIGSEYNVTKEGTRKIVERSLQAVREALNA